MRHSPADPAADCRVNTFFTSLSPRAFTRVDDCLTTQVQELFGCEGVVYAGSESSLGDTCRPMQVVHAGIGISSGDFDALIDDVVAGLQEAGVEQKDIDAAAPALLGMKDDIVVAPSPRCSGPALPPSQPRGAATSFQRAVGDASPRRFNAAMPGMKK